MYIYNNSYFSLLGYFLQMHQLIQKISKFKFNEVQKILKISSVDSKINVWHIWRLIVYQQFDRGKKVPQGETQ